MSTFPSSLPELALLSKSFDAERIRSGLYVSAILLLVFYVYQFGLYLYRRTAPSLNNVTGPPSSNFLTGNVMQLMSEEGYDFHMDIAQNYGGVVKLHAVLGAKQLYVFDHAAMHSVLIKNGTIWQMPDLFLASNTLIFGPCFVSIEGRRHHRARKIMNPVFGTSRIREMLPMVYAIAYEMRDSMSQATAKGNPELDLNHILESTILELIGQAGLGHSFAADKGSSALEGMKRLLFHAKRMIIPMQVLPFLRSVVPAPVLRALIPVTPIPDLSEARDLADGLHAKSQDILNKKRAAIASGDEAVLEQVGQGKDLMSVLIRANNKLNAEDQLPNDELVAHMNVFIFAAVDTTSSAMGRALQELAMDQDIQNRLREEIDNATAHGDLDFDTLLTMPILDAVYRETLRMYPPAVTTSRQAHTDTTMPLTRPMTGVDGSTISELFIPKGTIAHVALKAANQDRNVWGPDALEWKPERWLKPLPQSVLESHIPSAFPYLMSFVGGRRGCIGFKFAELMMKVLISVLIKSFVFSTTEKEIVWKVGVVEGPTVKGEQSLPLRVTPVTA